MNVLEMTEIREYIDNLNDPHMKKLLNNLHFEYGQYHDVGTPKECKQYKEYCSMSVSDVMTVMWKSFEVLKTEMDAQKKYYEEEIRRIKNDINSKYT